jgi:hypothetical protein
MLLPQFPKDAEALAIPENIHNHDSTDPRKSSYFFFRPPTPPANRPKLRLDLALCPAAAFCPAAVDGGGPLNAGLAGLPIPETFG